MNTKVPMVPQTGDYTHSGHVIDYTHVVLARTTRLPPEQYEGFTNKGLGHPDHISSPLMCLVQITTELGHFYMILSTDF